MARKPATPKAAPALPPPGGTDREKIVAAFMALLAEKRFEEIGFADIAGRADVSLATLRGEIPAAQAILAGLGDLRASEDPQDKAFIAVVEAFTAAADRQPSLDRPAAGAKRRNQDHLRRRRPYQEGRGYDPPQIKAEITRQRRDAMNILWTPARIAALALLPRLIFCCTA